MTDIETRGYVHADVLVSTDWVQGNLGSTAIRIVESNEDPLLYPSGHIPGAVEVDWTRDLNDPIKRDYITEAGFEKLMRSMGATRDTTIVFYGDRNNWWAAYAFWVFSLFGHNNCKIIDGGRIKWIKEGRPITQEVPSFVPSDYKASPRNDNENRAFRNEVMSHADMKGKLIDVRSPEEYSGARLHMPDYPNEGALRGGHIPGAKNIPWAKAVNVEDGTFKTAEELREIYEVQNGFQKSDESIAYCRIGERSSHTWFVLKYLLGYENVKNYDGSWTEWGNLVNAPIEK
jgi:thiosulfate/3-mercaptopyruvate sulfurtransferase